MPQLVVLQLHEFGHKKLAAAIGRYQLVFHLADYFKASDVTLPDPPFLDKVVIHFAIYEDKDHYHVPLLCSPWSHSTYRGS